MGNGENCEGFAVWAKTKFLKKFYVSHTSPSKYDIDVFGVKTGVAQEGLPGEIADLTEEIAANPDFYLSYNNRGLAE